MSMAIKDKLLDLYNSKSESEQRLILMMGVIFIIFILYTTYTSVSEGLAMTENKLAKQLELNRWAAEQITIIQDSKQGGATGSRGGSMTQIINSSARKHGVSLSRIQPQKTDMVKVGVDEIGFNRLVSWLAELENRHGIKATNIDLSKADTSGLVKLRRLDLERG